MSAVASRSTTTLWSGVLGVLAPVGALILLPIWQFPATGASAAQLMSFVTEHQRALQGVMVLNTLGVTLWLVFAVGVGHHMSRAVEDSSALPIGFMIGSGGFVTLLLAGFTAFDILVYRLPARVEARLLYDLTFGLLAMSGMPTAVALTCYALACRRIPALPGWTGGLAWVTAAAHVLLLLSFLFPSGFFSLQGEVITVVPGLLFIWIFATAIALRPDRSPQPTPHDAGTSRRY
jgi:hypothetical protein